MIVLLHRRSERGNFLSCLILAVLVLLGLSSCNDKNASNKKVSGEELVVLAVVANFEITENDLKSEAKRRQVRGMPYLDKKSLLEAMVDRLAVLHRARASGLQENPEVRREIDNLLISKYLSKNHNEELKSVQVTDNEIKEEYENRIKEFTRDPMSKFSVLKLSAGKAATENKTNEVRSEMVEARKLAIQRPISDGRGPASKGFGALAVKYSEDQSSRYRGGDIGWRVVGSEDPVWPKVLMESAHALEKGSITEIIEDKGTFYLAMKTDHRPQTVQNLDEVKVTLRMKILREKREQIQRSFREMNAEVAGVMINQEELEKINIPEAVNLREERENIPQISNLPTKNQ